MPAPLPAADVEELLAQMGWVRALARGLLADEGRAEDLVQETFRAALEARPSGGPGLRSWLAAVLRHLGSNARRREGRLRHREAAAAKPEAVPGAAELAELAERMRGVVHAVAELPEPHRTVILLRYFEDLPPHRIARRLSLPQGTVRSRLHRALARLREELGTRYGREDLGAWLAGLLPAGASAGASLTPWISEIVLMTAKTKIAFAAAGALLVGLLLWKEFSEGPPPEVKEARTPTAASMPDLPAKQPEVAALAPDETPAEKRTGLAADRDGPRGGMRLRVVDSRGRPIPKARVQADNRSWYGFDAGLPKESWDALRHHEKFEDQEWTDEEGRVRLKGMRTDLPVLLYVAARGFALRGAQKKPEEGAADQDLGELVLAPGAWLQVTVRDEDGAPVKGAEVQLEAEATLPRGTLYFQTEKTGARGEAVFPYLLPKTQDLTVTAPGYLLFTREAVLPGAQGRTRVEVVLERGLAIEGVVLEANGSPASGVPVFVAPEGTDPRWLSGERALGFSETRTRTDSKGRFRATGLVAGRNYMVLARRGPTRWVSSESVHAGSHPTLTLPASFFVRGRLVLPGGEPARGGRIGFVNTQRPFDEAMDQLFQPVDEEGRFKLELAAATYGIFVQHPKGQGLLDPVEVEEETDLGDLTVPAGVPLRITVLSSWDESPVDLPMIRDDSVDVLVESKNLDPEIWRKKIREAAARRLPPRPVYEERNVVLLERLEPGHHRLMVSRQGFVQGFLEVDLEAGQPKEMTLHLDPASRVHLTVLKADGTPAADQYFILNPAAPGKLSSAHLTTGPDGLAVFQELAPGRYRFLFQSPEGYLHTHGDLDVRPGENHLHVVLPGRCNLTVAVSGVAGPLQGQQVRLAPLGEGAEIPDTTAKTGADGTARFPDLWTGPYRVTVERPGRPARQRKIELEQEEERLEIGFGEGTILSGRLKAPGAGTLEHGTVSLQGFGADPSQVETADYEKLRKERGLEESSGRTGCGTDGSFQFQGVEPGVYRLFGTADGYVYSRSIPVRVGGSPVKGVAIPLEPEARLVLNVKGLPEYAARHELDFLEIRLATSKGEEPLNLVQNYEKDGENVFEKVKPGFYRVRIYRGTFRGGLKKTLIAEIPVELPAGSTTLEWDASAQE